jgi:hypothetical protein
MEPWSHQTEGRDVQLWPERARMRFVVLVFGKRQKVILQFFPLT